MYYEYFLAINQKPKFVFYVMFVTLLHIPIPSAFRQPYKLDLEINQNRLENFCLSIVMILLSQSFNFCVAHAAKVFMYFLCLVMIWLI